MPSTQKLLSIELDTLHGIASTLCGKSYPYSECETEPVLTLDIIKLYNGIKDSWSRLYQELAEGLRGKIEARYAKRRGLAPQV